MNIKKIPKEQWEQCPNCDNSGAIVVQKNSRSYVTRDMAMDACDISLEVSLYSDDEFEIEQCEFCYTNPKSVFNQTKLLKGEQCG